MKRLLFIDQYGDMGGGQRVLISMVRAALAADHAVTVLAPAGGALQTALTAHFSGRVAFHPCEEPRLAHGRKGPADIIALLAYGWRFRRHLPLLRMQDYIHVNGLRHLPHLLVLARRLKAPVSYHIHIVHSRVEKLLLRLAARARGTFALVVNSRFVRDGLGFSSPRIRLVENALDGAFADLSFLDRFAAGGTLRAAVIGTLRPEKGQDVAIAAVARLHGMRLHLIGRDGDGAQDWIAGLRARASTQVHFDGPVADPARAIAEHGIQFNLVPSRWDEPFGLVAIEGMACSCLTIVSGRGGLHEIAERTGALVARNAQELGGLLADLCARPAAELASLAQNQYVQTMAHYAPRRFEAEIGALFAEALKKPPGAAIEVGG